MVSRCKKRIAGFLPRPGQQIDQLGIVVQHLFEMGREPHCIYRIARKAAAEMIIDATLAHFLQGQQNSVA